MADIRWVKPGGLRLPTTRSDGADQFKLIQQMLEFGETFDDMPPLWVTECRGGELLIANGVTRATRAYRADPEMSVPVDVIDVEPTWDVSQRPTIADMAEP